MKKKIFLNAVYFIRRYNKVVGMSLYIIIKWVGFMIMIILLDYYYWGNTGK
jgi:hypothetical protein